ncbi:MAG: RHS repeat-associated core domain-containing protein [Bacteroidales bacterium]
MNNIGNFVFEDQELAYILTSEGRVVPEEKGMSYQYFMKDHLGNNRVLFDEKDTIIQQKAYYPFGMSIDYFRKTLPAKKPNRYLYNGKELQGDFGLDWYDYGARMYDPALARWHMVDPVAEEREWLSSYNFCSLNPISRTDLTGALDDWFENELTGDIYYHPTMKKGDEGTGAMKGEGWKHMGENGMFGSDDQLLIMSNSDKASVGFVEVPISDQNTGDEIGKVSMRAAMFKGLKAQKFMADKGYSFEPSKVLVEDVQLSYPSVETGPGSVSILGGKKTTIGLTGTYAKNGTVPVTVKTDWKVNDVKYNYWTGLKTITDVYVNDLKYVPKKGSGYYFNIILEISNRSQGNHNYQREVKHNAFPQYQ